MNLPIPLFLVVLLLSFESNSRADSTGIPTVTPPPKLAVHESIPAIELVEDLKPMITETDQMQEEVQLLQQETCERIRPRLPRLEMSSRTNLQRWKEIGTRCLGSRPCLQISMHHQRSDTISKQVGSIAEQCEHSSHTKKIRQRSDSAGVAIEASADNWAESVVRNHQPPGR